jgi:hypothetical protein
MDKDALLRTIAETGYNVGFGAKKHFATYDIVEKLPGTIGFVSLAIGILSLVFDQLSAKVPSACLAIAGVASLFVSHYDHVKMNYERVGRELTCIYNELRTLYRQVQGGAELGASHDALVDLENSYYAKSISKQIIFSDWYAHYKFFSQMQIDWVDEQKKFTWRDKVPVSFLVVFCLIIGLVLFAFIGIISCCVGSFVDQL